jgi:hypothetical protein
MRNLAKEDRIQLIKQLQEARGNSFIITYITSTRPGFELPMAMDTIRLFYEHLLKINNPKQTIELFIHSNGGDGTVPWRLVNLLRENCNTFNVIVPNHAFSAATLTALGADKIIMHPMGALGPTDPKVTNEYNPKDPDSKQQLGISVEDVTAFIDLLRDDVGIRHEDELVLAFNNLADKVHPLALGNVKRSRSQSRQLACKLLALHMDAKADGHKIDEIVERLTSKSFYHGHPINRVEAKTELGLNIESTTKDIEEIIWKLYLEYEQEMLLNKPFKFVQDFIAAFPNIQPNQPQVLTLPKMKAAYIESEYYSDVLIVENQIIGIKANNTYAANLSTLKDGWVRE